MFLKNRNIIFKIKISKVTDYAALNNIICSGVKIYEVLYSLDFFESTFHRLFYPSVCYFAWKTPPMAVFLFRKVRKRAKMYIYQILVTPKLAFCFNYKMLVAQL